MHFCTCHRRHGNADPRPRNVRSVLLQKGKQSNAKGRNTGPIQELDAKRKPLQNNPREAEDAMIAVIKLQMRHTKICMFIEERQSSHMGGTVACPLVGTEVVVVRGGKECQQGQSCFASGPRTDGRENYQSGSLAFG